jgi:hypothetical protein
VSVTEEQEDSTVVKSMATQDSLHATYTDLLALTFTDLNPMMIYRLDRFGRGGHHRPFNDAGFAGNSYHGGS